jgi:hypothetical protein
MIETRAIKAGVLYCLVVFVAALVLGGLRTLWVTPLAGEFIALTLEAPVMLAVAWSACAWAAERMEVSEQFHDRLAMGGIALAGLIGAEAVIAILAAGRTPEEYFGDHARSAILLGLLVQLAFAVFPVLRRRRGA